MSKTPNHQHYYAGNSINPHLHAGVTYTNTSSLAHNHNNITTNTTNHATTATASTALHQQQQQQQRSRRAVSPSLLAPTRASVNRREATVRQLVESDVTRRRARMVDAGLVPTDEEATYTNNRLMGWGTTTNPNTTTSTTNNGGGGARPSSSSVTSGRHQQFYGDGDNARRGGPLRSTNNAPHNNTNAGASGSLVRSVSPPSSTAGVTIFGLKPYSAASSSTNGATHANNNTNNHLSTRGRSATPKAAWNSDVKTTTTAGKREQQQQQQHHHYATSHSSNANGTAATLTDGRPLYNDDYFNDYGVGGNGNDDGVTEGGEGYHYNDGTNSSNSPPPQQHQQHQYSSSHYDVVGRAELSPAAETLYQQLIAMTKDRDQMKMVALQCRHVIEAQAWKIEKLEKERNPNGYRGGGGKDGSGVAEEYAQHQQQEQMLMITNTTAGNNNKHGNNQTSSSSSPQRRSASKDVVSDTIRELKASLTAAEEKIHSLEAQLAFEQQKQKTHTSSTSIKNTKNDEDADDDDDNAKQQQQHQQQLKSFEVTLSTLRVAHAEDIRELKEEHEEALASLADELNRAHKIERDAELAQLQEDFREKLSAALFEAKAKEGNAEHTSVRHRRSGGNAQTEPASVAADADGNASGKNRDILPSHTAEVAGTASAVVVSLDSELNFILNEIRTLVDWAKTNDDNSLNSKSNTESASSSAAPFQRTPSVPMTASDLIAEYISVEERQKFAALMQHFSSSNNGHNVAGGDSSSPPSASAALAAATALTSPVSLHLLSAAQQERIRSFNTMYSMLADLLQHAVALSRKERRRRLEVEGALTKGIKAVEEAVEREGKARVASECAMASVAVERGIAEEAVAEAEAERRLRRDLESRQQSIIEEAVAKALAAAANEFKDISAQRDVEEAEERERLSAAAAATATTMNARSNNNDANLSTITQEEEKNALYRDFQDDLDRQRLDLLHRHEREVETLKSNWEVSDLQLRETILALEKEVALLNGELSELRRCGGGGPVTTNPNPSSASPSSLHQHQQQQSPSTMLSTATSPSSRKSVKFAQNDDGDGSSRNDGIAMKDDDDDDDDDGDRGDTATFATSSPPQTTESATNTNDANTNNTTHDTSALLSIRIAALEHELAEERSKYEALALSVAAQQQEEQQNEQNHHDDEVTSSSSSPSSSTATAALLAATDRLEAHNAALMEENKALAIQLEAALAEASRAIAAAAANAAATQPQPQAPHAAAAQALSSEGVQEQQRRSAAASSSASQDSASSATGDNTTNINSNAADTKAILEAQLQALQEQLLQLRYRRQDADQQHIVEENELFAQSQRQTEILTAQIESLESQLKEREGEIERLQQTIADIESTSASQLTAMATNNAQRDAEVNALRDEIAALNAKLITAASDATVSEKEREKEESNNTDSAAAADVMGVPFVAGLSSPSHHPFSVKPPSSYTPSPHRLEALKREKEDLEAIAAFNRKECDAMLLVVKERDEEIEALQKQVFSLESAFASKLTSSVAADAKSEKDHKEIVAEEKKALASRLCESFDHTLKEAVAKAVEEQRQLLSAEIESLKIQIANLVKEGEIKKNNEKEAEEEKNEEKEATAESDGPTLSNAAAANALVIAEKDQQIADLTSKIQTLESALNDAATEADAKKRQEEEEAKQQKEKEEEEEEEAAKIPIVVAEKEKTHAVQEAIASTEASLKEAFETQIHHLLEKQQTEHEAVLITMMEEKDAELQKALAEAKEAILAAAEEQRQEANKNSNENIITQEEKEKEATEEAVAKALAASEERLAALRSELSEAHAAALAAEESRWQSKLNALEEAKRVEIEHVKETLIEEFEAKAKQTEEAFLAQQQHEQQQHLEALEAVRAEVEEAKKQHQEVLSEANQRQTELVATIEALTAKCTQLEADHMAEMKALDEKYAADLKDLQNDLDAVTENTRALEADVLRLSREKEDLIASHETEKEMLNGVFMSERRSLEEAIADAQAELNTLRTAVAAEKEADKLAFEKILAEKTSLIESEFKEKLAAETLARTKEREALTASVMASAKKADEAAIEVALIQKMLDQIQKENDSLAQAAEEKENQLIQEREATRELMREERVKMQHERDAAERMVNELMSSTAGLKETNVKRMDEIRLLEQKLFDVQQQLHDAVGNANVTFEEKEKTIADLKHRNALLEEQVPLLEASLAAAQQKLQAQMTNTNTNINSSSGVSSEDVQRLQKHISKLEEQLRESREELRKKSEAVVEAEENNAKSSADAVARVLEAAEEDMRNLRTAFEIELKNKEDRINSLKAYLETARETIEQTQSEVEALREANANAGGRSDGQQQQKDMSTIVSDGNATNDLGALQLEVNRLRKENKRIEQTLKQVQMEKDELISELEYAATAVESHLTSPRSNPLATAGGAADVAAPKTTVATNGTSIVAAGAAAANNDEPLIALSPIHTLSDHSDKLAPSPLPPSSPPVARTERSATASPPSSLTPSASTPTMSAIRRESQQRQESVNTSLAPTAADNGVNKDLRTSYLGQEF